MSKNWAKGEVKQGKNWARAKQKLRKLRKLTKSKAKAEKNWRGAIKKLRKIEQELSKSWEILSNSHTKVYIQSILSLPASFLCFSFVFWPNFSPFWDGIDKIGMRQTSRTILLPKCASSYHHRFVMSLARKVELASSIHSKKSPHFSTWIRHSWCRILNDYILRLQKKIFHRDSAIFFYFEVQGSKWFNPSRAFAKLQKWS